MGSVELKKCCATRRVRGGDSVHEELQVTGNLGSRMLRTYTAATPDKALRHMTNHNDPNPTCPELAMPMTRALRFMTRPR